MKFIDNKNITDPHINLALEEYILRNITSDETFLLFYVNEPSIIIGKNQNTIEEINQEYVTKNNIHVVRRISGGGAVYHDLGNLNFSFITNFEKTKFSNYKEFTGPVIKALGKMGANAEQSGRNDIIIEGKKVSGNAQFTSRNRMFSHGTLLLDSHIGNVVSALKVKAGKIESKGIKSIRSRVANICEFLPSKITMESFKQIILESIFNTSSWFPQLELTTDDWNKVYQIADTKYRTWQWNYGISPKFNLRRTARFPIGEIDIMMNIDKGYINSIKVYGDFFGQSDICNFENLLTNVRYEKSDIQSALAGIDLNDYFGSVQSDEIISLIY
jgi:lipoate-protein ligase A